MWHVNCFKRTNYLMQKILLVNNDLDLLSLLKTWLEHKKTYRVQVTTSHKDVRTIIRHFQPELVLADIMQKKAVEEIKGNEYSKNIPVILMSGHTGLQKNEQYPVDDFIEKPFDLSLLEIKMQQLLGKTGMGKYNS